MTADGFAPTGRDTRGRGALAASREGDLVARDRHGREAFPHAAFFTFNVSLFKLIFREGEEPTQKETRRSVAPRSHALIGCFVYAP